MLSFNPQPNFYLSNKLLVVPFCQSVISCRPDMFAYTQRIAAKRFFFAEICSYFVFFFIPNFHQFLVKTTNICCSIWICIAKLLNQKLCYCFREKARSWFAFLMNIIDNHFKPNSFAESVFYFLAPKVTLGTLRDPKKLNNATVWLLLWKHLELLGFIPEDFEQT